VRNRDTRWLSEQTTTIHLTHYRSFWRQVYPGHWLHWYWQHISHWLLLCPGRGAEYCDQCVCVYISGTTGPIVTKFVVQILYGHGSVFLWRRCDTLCTSCFMDDVTFGHSGPYGDVWLVALWYRGGVWCLWMSCYECF